MFGETSTTLTMKERTLEVYLICEVHGPNCIKPHFDMTSSTFRQLRPGFPVQLLEHFTNALREHIAARHREPSGFTLQIKLAVARTGRECGEFTALDSTPIAVCDLLA